MQTIAPRAPGKDPRRLRNTPRSQQIRQRKGQQFEGNEEYDFAVDPKTGWRFYYGSRRNLPRASSSSSNWDRTYWKTSILNCRVRTDWSKTSRQPTGGVRTPTQTACTDAHSVPQHILNRLTTFHHANTRGSRAGRLRIAHLCVPITSVTHVSCLVPCRT